MDRPSTTHSPREIPRAPLERYRDHLPTLRDLDPLRHDIGYSRERDASRDSMPTLPELDPLRHDQGRSAER
jgi:hypothetical protein